MRIQTHGPEAYARLEALAVALREANPGQTWTVEDGAVWLRHGDKDLGIYSLYLGSDIPVYCVEDGKTALHRPVPAEA